MRITLALARRELFAFLLTPAGYVIGAVFMLFSAVLYFVIGAVFGGGFNQGEPASLRLFFTGGIWVFLFVAPAISMRALADEYRLGTIEMLMTCPVRERQVVLGKFLGSLGYLVVILLPTLIFVYALQRYGKLDVGQVASGYAAMIAAGGAFLATGIAFSTMTASQVLAYLATLFFWLILLMTTKGLPFVGAILESRRRLNDDTAGWIDQGTVLLTSLTRQLGVADPQRVIGGFANGLVDSYNVIYFLVVIVCSLVISIVMLQRRRWM